MMPALRSACLVSFVLLFQTVCAQSLDTSVLYRPWKASWIEVPGEPANGYGVYIFRKSLNLTTKPSSFRVHVSADNRYKLFVNEKLVSLGPARGDIAHWNFETVDLAQWLKPGNNVIAALVWNEAQWRPEAQISYRTGFILQGATSREEKANTNDSWKCIRDNSYKPIPLSIPTVYYVSGPGEHINMASQIKNWSKADFDDSSWKNANPIIPGTPKNLLGAFGIPVGWLLMPSIIPQMEMKEQRLTKVRESKGVTPPESFPSSKSPFNIPANTTATILLDQQTLTNAYPTLIFSGGNNASITLKYAETLYSKFPEKGNRNDTEGKEFVGRMDSIISDGSSSQQFTPLSWRTYRYLLLSINTKDQPLVIDDIFGTFTGYPFEFNASFESDNPELKKFLETGWHTARLCAVETYMDCPYYEQLQYIGDARIQAMISLYNSGDDRLIKNALNLMDNSRQPEGVTLSRHPSYSPQFIPNFSLWYVGMLHDYLMYGRDTNFLKMKLPGARQVLSYFRNFQRKDGSTANVPFWMFTDWVETKGWINGEAPYGADSSSALNDLQLLFAYQKASDMERRSGIAEYASIYNRYASQLQETIRKKYWDNSKGLFADRPEKDLFSQHANALAILTDVVTGEQSLAIAKKILSDNTLAPASIYFKYYLHMALIKAGLGNDYISWLDTWRQNLKMGLTTWAEQPDINTTRSDCHAWGASPNIELFRTVLGIDSDGPAFSRIRIEPRPGQLKHVKGEIPHANGKIGAEYTRKNNSWQMIIRLPKETSGNLVWKGKTYPLKAGVNEFNL